jgi:aspartyl-tRNA synthetase
MQDGTLPAAGVDPLTGAPASITAQQRKESGIDAAPKKLEQS